MSQVKERPITFNSEMVNAIREGRKTQTRCVIDPQPNGFAETLSSAQVNEAWQSGFVNVECPYGQIGDRLWVREKFRFYSSDECDCYYNFVCAGCAGKPVYYADDQDDWEKWKRSIHMPRSASRILLEITNVRVERLNDISEEDSECEGFNYLRGDGGSDISPDVCRKWFKNLWKKMNGAGSWDKNPWVWVIEFEVFENLK